MKKLICCLLLALLLVQLVPLAAVPAFAEEELPVVLPEALSESEAGLSGQVFRSLSPEAQAAAAELRQKLVARQETISVTLTVTQADQELKKQIWEAALEHTGKPNEGDYIQYQRGAVNMSGSYQTVNGSLQYTITYTLSYYTTAAEEQKVDTKVKSILSSLKLDGKTDAQKVKAIYDYLAKNVTYDNDHLSDPTYMKQFTCYAALCQGKSVCQGYALSLYRLLLEAGVDCRYIRGQADGGNGYGAHAWNIIKLGAYYYNADVTWDAVNKQYNQPYEFYLRCNKNFKKHNRDAEFTTSSFNAAYPMSPKDYDGSEQPVSETGFTDVVVGSYYEPAVLWAVNNGVTTGTGAKTFSPEAKCTRAQVVTFLWRAKGKPAPASNENPFTDVKEGEYYYDAVLWALEKDITTGTSTTTFSPETKCTRGQIVTFLWRTEDKPEPTSEENPFKDVKRSEYYYLPVLWAVEKGITNGTSKTTFSPETKCTRAQVVTFLYRDLG